MVLVQLKNLIYGAGRSNGFFAVPATTGTGALKHAENSGLQTTEFHPAESSSASSKLVLEKSSLDIPVDMSTAARALSNRIDPRVISDATIGLSDGLTVPFALTAGLSALGSSKVVISGGLAELIAGAISMGLGGWLAARSEVEAHETLLRSTRSLVQHSPRQAMFLIHEKIAPLVSDTAGPLLDELSNEMLHVQRSQKTQLLQEQHDSRLTELLMCLQHQAPELPPNRAFISAFIIAFSYFIGGLVPLFPYFFVADVSHALWWSICVMAVALGIFGAGKTLLLSTLATTEGRTESMSETLIEPGRARIKMLLKCLKGGGWMILMGGVAAFASMALVRGFTGRDSS